MGSASNAPVGISFWKHGQKKMITVGQSRVWTGMTACSLHRGGLLFRPLYWPMHFIHFFFYWLPINKK